MWVDGVKRGKGGGGGVEGGWGGPVANACICYAAATRQRRVRRRFLRAVGAGRTWPRTWRMRAGCLVNTKEANTTARLAAEETAGRGGRRRGSPCWVDSAGGPPALHGCCTSQYSGAHPPMPLRALLLLPRCSAAKDRPLLATASQRGLAS